MSDVDRVVSTIITISDELRYLNVETIPALIAAILEVNETIKTVATHQIAETSNITNKIMDVSIKIEDVAKAVSSIATFSS